MHRQVDIDGIKIHFTENKTAGDTLVFIHGSSESSKIWYNQVGDIRLSENYRLVCIDLPGHGESSHPSINNAYRFNFFEKAIRKLLNRICIDRYVLIPFSLSTNIVAEIRQFSLSCKGLFLVGSSVANKNTPLDKLLLPFSYGHILTSPLPNADEVRCYLKGLTHKKNRVDLKLLYDDFMRSDPNFRKVLGETFVNIEWHDEIDNLKKSSIPISFIFGQNEEIINVKYQTAILKDIGNTYQVPDAGHLIQLDQPQVFNNLLIDFTTYVFTHT